MLTAEGEVVDECLPKHNFTKEDLDEILLTLWTSKDLIYISERDKVEFTLLLHTYCWTGARLSAFFSGEGLRYKVWLRITSSLLSAYLLCRTSTLSKDEGAMATNIFGRLINDGSRTIVTQIL